MKRVIVRSVYDAFEYVMDHYAPFGLEDMAPRKDSYAVISIQDTHTGGFGIEFTTSHSCIGVLTLLFDDLVSPEEGAVLFDRKMARQIIDFTLEYKDKIDTMLVHCYGGQSRSRAVGAFIVKMLGHDNSRYFEKGNPNEYVYRTLEEVYNEGNKHYGGEAS